MLGCALLASLGTALLFGAAPAVTASQANPSEDLRNSQRTTSGGKSGRVRGGLVAAQVALSVVLLTGSGLLIRSFVQLQTVNLGFRTENLMAAHLSVEPLKYEDPEALTQFFQGVLDDVRAMPQVREYEIVGVAGDMRITAVNRSPGYQMYFGYDEIHPVPSNSRALMVRTQGDMASLIPVIRRKVRERDPDAPLTEVSTMKDVVSASLTGNRVLGLATALFAVTALLLSMTGLYAVLAYYVSCRTREIGIRVAFGATGAHVMRSVLGRGLVLVVIGLGVGFACAFGVTRLLQAQLYQVETTDPLTFVSVGMGLMVLGVLASLLPARRATRVDPVRAMQVE